MTSTYLITITARDNQSGRSRASLKAKATSIVSNFMLRRFLAEGIEVVRIDVAEVIV